MKKGIISVLAATAGIAAGAAGVSYLMNKEVKFQKNKVKKFKGYYNLLNQWLILKSEGKSISEYFLRENYKEISVYGMGELGNRLLEELKVCPVKVKYGIDKKAGGTYLGVDIISPEDELDKTDAIIVTAFFEFDEIRKELSKTADCPIISLEDVIYSI
jgi:autonomous glycyl radical cofactor GrcA